MRNLKRALSLALASVMLLGMMVVGTSAASYPDVDENDNVEAIEVLNAVNVMIGDRGNFRPDAKVNRHEMAVIMAKLVLGNDIADNYVGSHPFTDTFPWADKYVAACYENDLISGRGGNLFAGNQPLTAVEAASMMLRALGYKDLNKGADDWRAPLVAMANQLRLFNGVTADPKAELNRNQVAQLVLNTLKSYVVDLKDNTFNIADGSGAIVITGGNREYIARSSQDAFAQAISAVENKGTSASSVGGYTIELGEHLYNGDLELRDNASDDFERPSRTWVYDGKEIGTFAKEELLKASYTTGVSCRTLYDLLSRANLLDYDLEYYVDGVVSSAGASDILTRSTKDFGATGKGVLTEVYVNNARKEITVVSINTWLAQAAADYNSSRETVSLKVYTSHAGDTTSSTTHTVSAEDVPAIKGLKKDDFVLVNRTGKYQPTKMSVVTVSEPEIIRDTAITAYSKGSSSEVDSDTVKALFKNVTANGTKYDGSAQAHYNAGALNAYNNQLLTDKTYNVYLDNYGYAIGVDLCEGEDNYIFITGYDLDSSSIAAGDAKANAIFLDGTSKTITVNVTDTNKNIKAVEDALAGGGTDPGLGYFEQWKSATAPMTGTQTYAINRWYTYTVRGNEYTLNPATRMFTTEVTTGTDPTTIKTNSGRIDAGPAAKATTGGKNAKVPATDTRKAFGNDDSVFIVAELGNVAEATGHGKVITGVDGVYTGVQNVEIEVNAKATDAAAGAETFVPEVTGGATATALVESVYTLFNSNNYIIGTVIIGEAKGSDSNLAYIKTAATLEKISGDDYYWEFEAVLDGEIQTLTVKSKFASTIKSLAPGHVQELRYDGDYVVGIKNPGAAKFYTLADYTTAAIDDESIYDLGHKANSSECKLAAAATDHGDIGYVAAEARLSKTNASGLHLDGRTMYLMADQSDYGLYLTQDAKGIVYQSVDGDWDWNEYDSVSEAIETLGDADSDTEDVREYAGRIVSVLDSTGRAKWVLFLSDTDVKTGSIVTPTGKLVGVEDTNVELGTPDATKDTAWANIMKAQADGLYQSDYVKSTWAAGVNAEDILHAKFTATGTSTTLVIKDSKGTTWYSETQTTVADTPYFFSIHIANGVGHYDPNGAGKLTTTGTLPKGTYTVSITGCDPMEFTIR